MSNSSYYALTIGDSERAAHGSQASQSIPFARFVEYLQAFSRIIGHEKSVTFSRTEPGSTRVIVEVPTPAIKEKIDQRINRPSLPTQRCLKKLKRLLHEDQCVADIGFSSGSMEFHTVLRLSEFHDYDFDSYRQRGTLDGFVVRVGDSDTPTVPVHIKSRSGERHLCRAPSRIGFEMGRYRGICLRVSGEGVWRKTLGYWRAEAFVIESYTPLKSTRTLKQALSSMRDTRFIEELAVRKDPAEYLSKLRSRE